MKNQFVRKIIKIEYSHLISLPIFWLQLVGFDTGDFVQLQLGKNRELIIKPKKVKKYG